MKPYYQDSTATIYLGDCREIVPSLEKADLVLTDPPYGMNFIHGIGGGCLARSTRFAGVSVLGDNKPFQPGFLLDFPEVILWGANHYAERLPSKAGWLIWDKRVQTCSNDQSDCELAWTNFLGTARTFYHLWNGMLKDSERGIQRKHPTQKPEALMTWCILLSSDPVTILDPFMGSGTTLRAAKDLGRKTIGIEIEEQYCEIAAKRLEQEVLFQQPTRRRIHQLNLGDKD